MKRILTGVLLVSFPLAILAALVATLCFILLILGVGVMAAGAFGEMDSLACLALVMAVVAASAVLYRIGRATLFILRDSAGVTERSEPDLMRHVEAVRLAMGAPHVRVHLGCGFVAHITPVRRVMVLGCALVRALDRDYLRAVIAHEFGHLFPGGSRYGWSLDRIGDTASRVVAFVADCRGDDDWKGYVVFPAIWPLWLVARIYLWAIDRLAPGWHACEYVADRLACEYCQNVDAARGATLFADALHAYAVLAWLWDREQRPNDFEAALSWLQRIRTSEEVPNDSDLATLNAYLASESVKHPPLNARRYAVGESPARWDAPFAREPWSPIPLHSHTEGARPAQQKKGIVAAPPGSSPKVNILEVALRTVAEVARRAVAVVSVIFAVGASTLVCNARSEAVVAAHQRAYVQTLTHVHQCPTAEDRYNECSARYKGQRDTSLCDLGRLALESGENPDAWYAKCVAAAKPFRPEFIARHCTVSTHDVEHDECVRDEHLALIAPIRKELSDRGCNQRVQELDSIAQETDEELLLHGMRVVQSPKRSRCE